MSPLPTLVPERTPLLDLPLIMPSQAQKHVTHNEAIRALDALVHLFVRAVGLNEPPSDVAENDRFVVGDAPAGPWAAAQAGQLASLEDGAWTFREPRAGWRAVVAGEEPDIAFDGTAWVPEASAAPERVERLGIAADADSTNRLAVSAPAALFTHAGADHRLVVNRASDADTASVVFQSGWSGRAEFGLAGDSSWRVKVSADGTSWRDALVAEPESGAVRFPGGINPEQLVSPPAAPGLADGEVLGSPNIVTVPFDRINVSIVVDWLYFSAFLVDRPTELTGLHLAQYGASTTAGAVWRGGVFRLGRASGSAWRIGERVADCGTIPAGTTGHRLLAAPAGTVLEPGWYATAIGTNGAGASLRVVRSMTGGLAHLTPLGDGADTDIFLRGAAVYMLMAGEGATIANGLPAAWDRDALSVQSQRFNTLQFALPRWRAW